MTVSELINYLSRFEEDAIVSILIAGDSDAYECLYPPEFSPDFDQVVITAE